MAEKIPFRVNVSTTFDTSSRYQGMLSKNQKEKGVL